MMHNLFTSFRAFFNISIFCYHAGVDAGFKISSIKNQNLMYTTDKNESTFFLINSSFLTCEFALFRLSSFAILFQLHNLKKHHL